MIARKPYGPEIDIWAMGVILFVMLTGRLPFIDKNLSKLFVSIMSGKYVLPLDISNEAKDLITNLFILKPQDRISLAKIKQHAWSASSPYLLNTSTLPEVDTERLQGMGFIQEDIQDYLTTGKPGPIKTVHYLLNQDESSDTVPRTQLDGPSAEPVVVPYSHPDPVQYNLAQSEPRKGSLFARIRNDRLSFAYSEESVVYHKYKSPIRPVFAFSEKAAPLEAIKVLADRLKQENIAFSALKVGETVACQWTLPTVLAIDLTQPDAYDQLLEQLQSEQMVGFKITIDEKGIYIQLDNDPDDWLIIKFQALCERLLK